MVDFSCLNTHLCGKIQLRHDYKVRNEVRKKSLPDPASGGWISVAQIDRLRPIEVDWLCVSEAYFVYWLWAKNRSRPAKPIIKAYYLASGIPLMFGCFNSSRKSCYLMSGCLICTTDADSTDLERPRCSETLCFWFVEDCHGLAAICPFYQFVVLYNGPVFCRSFRECLARVMISFHHKTIWLEQMFSSPVLGWNWFRQD